MTYPLAHAGTCPPPPTTHPPTHPPFTADALMSQGRPEPQLCAHTLTLPDFDTLRARMELVAGEIGVDNVDDGAVRVVMGALEVCLVWISRFAFACLPVVWRKRIQTWPSLCADDAPMRTATRAKAHANAH